MLAVLAALLGTPAIVNLHGVDSQIVFGSGSSSSASLNVACGGNEPAVKAFWPLGNISGSVHDWPPEPNATAELYNVPFSCVNVAASEPCIAHDHLFSRPIFYLRFAGDGGEQVLGPVHGYLSPFTLPDTTVVLSPRASWPMPSLADIMNVAGYAGDGGPVAIHLSVLFLEPSGPRSRTLPFRGFQGDDTLWLSNLPAPPSIPPSLPPRLPPSPPPPPHVLGTIKLWGASGGSKGSCSGAGGFVQVTVTLRRDVTYGIIVGGGGQGGCCEQGGGGMSAIMHGSGFPTDLRGESTNGADMFASAGLTLDGVASNMIAIAAGGGGGNSEYRGGSGGGEEGTHGSRGTISGSSCNTDYASNPDNGGGGGTQQSGGSSATSQVMAASSYAYGWRWTGQHLKGGQGIESGRGWASGTCHIYGHGGWPNGGDGYASCGNGAGGGGGWYGGGGGTYVGWGGGPSGSLGNSGGGGGGSSYPKSDLSNARPEVVSVTHVSVGDGVGAPQSGDPDYASSAGASVIGQGNGRHGLVVLTTDEGVTTTYGYTGTMQTWTYFQPPPPPTPIPITYTIKLWGASGGSRGSCSGAGGFVEATLALATGATYGIIVGGGGQGGCCEQGGGGMSAIMHGSGFPTDLRGESTNGADMFASAGLTLDGVASNMIAIAAGGGGGNSAYRGGSGGGEEGTHGSRGTISGSSCNTDYASNPDNGGGGGTQQSGGSSATSQVMAASSYAYGWRWTGQHLKGGQGIESGRGWAGGTCYVYGHGGWPNGGDGYASCGNGAGGGGGWYGGGGGTYVGWGGGPSGSLGNSGGGGGGSSYPKSDLSNARPEVVSVTHVSVGDWAGAPQSGDPDYASSAGASVIGQGNGRHGLVVLISEHGAKTTFSFTGAMQTFTV